MHRIIRTIVLVATAITTLGSSGHAAPTTDPVPNWTAEEAAMVEWAFDRFAAAGLALPTDVEIAFHRTKEACGGNEGRHRLGEIHICRTVDGNPEAERLLREHALLHELAHEWTAHNLSPERQAAFMALRGTETWNDRSHEWGDRGTEHAAEIMTWALLDREPGFLNLRNASCEAKTEGFRLLTGTDPITPDFSCAG